MEDISDDIMRVSVIFRDEVSQISATELAKLFDHTQSAVKGYLPPIMVSRGPSLYPGFFPDSAEACFPEFSRACFGLFLAYSAVKGYLPPIMVSRGPSLYPGYFSDLKPILWPIFLSILRQGVSWGTSFYP